MGLVTLIECHDEGELCLIRSLLTGNDIDFFVQNDHFGSLYPGPLIPFNTRVVLVPEEELGRAQVLLSQLEEPSSSDWDTAG